MLDGVLYEVNTKWIEPLSKTNKLQTGVQYKCNYSGNKYYSTIVGKFSLDFLKFIKNFKGCALATNSQIISKDSVVEVKESFYKCSNDGDDWFISDVTKGMTIHFCNPHCVDSQCTTSDGKTYGLFETWEVASEKQFYRCELISGKMTIVLRGCIADGGRHVRKWNVLRLSDYRGHRRYQRCEKGDGDLWIMIDMKGTL